ncbi:TetR/AcrR family transcriptional regulator [Paenibacillus sp. 1011MAR3C5]|uniref:TetR/AcrR family transcriptional regulator n=1 Tax=Paenibacillus sp. 1011MAR3C5 TaxID=1675787 RepID=UPI000E6B70EE|nr:TetR/AcrR family transcriptional regulator [Paenibacillus sp. 1011MAR3C5]RJE90127.1 TetR/AcrR family transcriptional regulator [Paenibacillus sp. 1011MAR3C5]
MSAKARSKREHILKSAMQLILTVDFKALTLDAVAKEAGVSKGGLLYHFPSKDALLQGITVHIFDQYTEMFHSYADQDSRKHGKWCRAYIQASRQDLKKHDGILNVGVMSAALLEPLFVESLNNSYAYWFGKMSEDGLDPITVNLIRLAIDGLYYSDMYKIKPLADADLDAVIDRLMKLTEKGETT